MEHAGCGFERAKVMSGLWNRDMNKEQKKKKKPAGCKGKLKRLWNMKWSHPEKVNDTTQARKDKESLTVPG
jgi:hypothetical protein